MSSPLPTPAAQLAEHQHGAVARVQLRRWMSLPAVDGLVTRGTLQRIERGVYRVAGSARTPEQAAMAAVLRARPHARLSGPFVLGLHDIDGFTPEDPFIVVTAPSRRLTSVEFLHRPGVSWDRPDTARRLPTVRVASAVVETSDPRWRIADRRLRVAIDHARWRGAMRTGDLIEAIERAAGAPGALRLIRLLEGGDLRAESEGERALAAILDGVVPAPERQVWIDDRYRADLYWPELRFAVEYDGSIDHRGERARARDEKRDQQLSESGVEVLRLRVDDLRRPSATRQRVIERLLARAAARLA